jgi:hypothetical protein
MLRVEPTNLQKPRGAPRPRRLLPNPPNPARRGASHARHEMLPPPDAAQPPPAELTAPLERPRSQAESERWSVRLELGDEEIAKLYGQGMARGAVVWRQGMVEWRPLLITPELSGLLRRTRTTLRTEPLPPAPPVPPAVVAHGALPPPPRLPSSLPPALAAMAVSPTTVAPTAMDVETPPKKRRPIEFAAVAAVAFAVAWIGHTKLSAKPPAPPAAAMASLPAPPPAPACEPPPPSVVSTGSGSGIPTVSINDLPLAGVAAAAGTRSARGSATRGATGTGGGAGSPKRADLVAAMSQVANAASGCGERSGPVRVVMSFTNSGVARGIQVSGQDLPAATRSCIIGAASRARVPAFTGDPVTVSKTL